MSASIEEAAAGLAQALDSGNEQDAVAAKALYAEALDGSDEADVSLGPIKRALDEGDIVANDGEADEAEAAALEAEEAQARADADADGFVL
jgi:hypothetical protein